MPQACQARRKDRSDRAFGLTGYCKFKDGLALLVAVAADSASEAELRLLSAVPGCQPGEYKESGGLNCIACPTGMSSPAGSTDVSDCELCGTGTYFQPRTVGGGLCKPCDAGTYANSLGSLKCTRCAEGTYSAAGAATCSDCDAGSVPTYRNTACVKCHAGAYAPLNAVKCKPCKRHHYSAEGSASCTACPASQFTSFRFHNLYQSPCRNCPPGTGSAEPGKPCTSCPPNTYGTGTGLGCQPCGNGKSPSNSKKCQCNAGAVWSPATGCV